MTDPMSYAGPALDLDEIGVPVDLRAAIDAAAAAEDLPRAAWVERVIIERLSGEPQERRPPLPPEDWKPITKAVMATHFDFDEPHGSKDGHPGIRSSLVAAIKDARGAVKRDVDSGAYRTTADTAHAANWLGTVGYLMALDQVGACFAVVGRPDSRRVPIIRALAAFADVTSGEAHALYALRCSVAHTYGLMNKGRDDRRQAHIFRLESHGDELVTLPPKSKRWNGALGDLPQMEADVEWTRISTRHVAELVEEIVTQVLPSHLAAGTLALDGEMSETEFLLGYQIGMVGPGENRPTEP